MDTKLKNNKCIRDFLIRVFFYLSILLFLIFTVAARHGYESMYQNKNTFLFTKGTIWNLPEFQEYAGDLFYRLMDVYAGPANALYYNATGNGSASGDSDETTKIYLPEDDIKLTMLYHYIFEEAGYDFAYSVETPHINLNTTREAMFTPASGIFICPEGKQLLYLWDGERQTLYYKANQSYTPDISTLSAHRKEYLRLVLMINEKGPYQSPILQQFERTIQFDRWMIFLSLVSLGLVFLFSLACLFTKKSAKTTRPLYRAKIKECCNAVRNWMEQKRTALREKCPWHKEIYIICGILLCFALGGVVLTIYFAMHFEETLWLLPVSLILVLCAVELFRFTRDMKKVAAKLTRVRTGDMNTPLVLSKHTPIPRIEEDINSLSEGLETAVEQRDKSNRMRVELITNVSHDLKTPLTSIINYADLLCEEPLSEQAMGYAQALRQKSYRLNKMVQDVFDFSKASSGNLIMSLQTLNLNKLILQTMADMDEKITESTLTFKTVFTEDAAYINADPDRLYRVFQNLFVNAIQYSLEHSRVYIQLNATEETVKVNVKSTSRAELDFDLEEIVERFVRADSSRTNEGSGLGLSIVRSFTESMGGNFHIKTDADMFCACLEFVRVPDPSTPHSPA